MEECVVDHGHVFRTILEAIGVDSLSDFHVPGRDHSMANPAKGPIDELVE